MFDKSILSEKLKSDGIVILKNYYDINFCKEAIREIEEGIDKFNDRVTITKSENTGGDCRLFGMDRVYNSAKVFLNETFFYQRKLKYLHCTTLKKRKYLLT